MSAISRIFPFALIAFASVLIGKLISAGSRIEFLAAVLIIIVCGIVSFYKSEYGLIILLFSMLLSPEIKLAQLPGRDVVIRFDDFLILTLFLVWLAKMSMQKEEGLFTKTPVNTQILIYTLICILFTARGAVLGFVKPVKSSFYVLKYVEYFIIYLLVVNTVKTREQIRHLTIAGLITFVIVCIYSYTLIGKTPRIYAPFDVDIATGSGESGTLGGYLLLIMSVLLAFFCYAPKTSIAAVFLGLFAFALMPFAYTLSRASFFAFIPMCLVIMVLSKRRKLVLLLLMIMGVIATPLIFQKASEKVTARIQETFSGEVNDEMVSSVLGVDIKESSALLRIKTWEAAIYKWIPSQPVAGYGITGVGMCDAQYPLVIGELGLVGFGVFIWLLWALWKNALIAFRTADDWFEKALSLGYIGCFVALILQSVAVNTFVIIRIMEPFWFLSGLVMLLPTLRARGSAANLK